MSPSDLHSILQWGGAAGLLLVCLITAIWALWRANGQLQLRIEQIQRAQLESAVEAIRTLERSSNAIEKLASAETQRGQMVSEMFSRLSIQIEKLDEQHRAWQESVRALVAGAINEVRAVPSAIDRRRGS